jgi:hypothetical protein
VKRDLIAILQESPDFAGGQMDRLRVALHLEQAAFRSSVWSGDGACGEQIART